MDITVLLADVADMRRIAVIASEAFQRNEEMFNTFCPQHWTDEGRDAVAERWTRIKKTDPNTRYLIAVDNASGLAVGFARWIIYNEGMPDFSTIEGEEPVYSSEDEREYATALIEDFMVPRMSRIKDTKGHLASLDILGVHPDYQRRGVGKALVKWGVDKADDLGIEACVESSVYGRGLYEKNGFVFVRDVEVKVPEKFKDRPVQTFAWLLRPKKA